MNKMRAYRVVGMLIALGAASIMIVAVFLLWNQRDVVDKCIESGGSYLPRSAICVGPDGRLIPQ